MPQSLSYLLIHIVFSTKDRAPTLLPLIRPALYAYLATVARNEEYECFSVGPGDLNSLIAYIDSQEEHHRNRSYQEEYRALLHKYGVDFDERYIWD